MKIIKLTAQIFIFCFLLFETVSSTPQSYKAADGREYLIEIDPKYNWYQAWHECARRDLQLLAIESAAKNQIVIDLLDAVYPGVSYNLWLGGNDEYSTSVAKDRPFYWSPTGQRFGYTAWSSTNPDNAGTVEHCVHMWSQYHYAWNDGYCVNQIGFICEPNYHVEKCQKDLDGKCAAIRQSSSSVSTEWTGVEHQLLTITNDKMVEIECLEKKLKYKMTLLQDRFQEEMQKMFTNQRTAMQNNEDELFNQINVLKTKLNEAVRNITGDFSKTLDDNAAVVNSVCPGLL